METGSVAVGVGNLILISVHIFLRTFSAGSIIEADLNQLIETMKPLIDGQKLACAFVQLRPFLRFGASVNLASGRLLVLPH